ncbi:hypothetical protein AMTRI_Chr08g207330 [Amborella trichopoda]
MGTLSFHLPRTSLSLHLPPTSISNPMAGPSLSNPLAPTDDVPTAQKLETAMARILGNLSLPISLNLPLCPPPPP